MRLMQRPMPVPGDDGKKVMQAPLDPPEPKKEEKPKKAKEEKPKG